MAQVTMPKMSDTMEEGKIVQWLKHEGDQVNQGEPIAEIETDKANVEMEAFESGVLGKIMVPEGETVSVGETIATIESAAATPAEAPSAEAPRPTEAPKTEEKVPEAPAPAPPPAQAAEAPKPQAPKPQAPAPPAPVTEEERIKASPLARRMAEEQGIDLSKVQGTGPNGRIVEADIEKLMGEKPAEPSIPAAPKPEAAAPAPPKPAAEVPTEQVELSKMRKAIADRMTRSKQTVPHFYVTTEIEMDWASRVRDELNADGDSKVSFTDMIVKACALALVKMPRVNASYHEDKMEMHKQVNIGIAVALEDGLIVPVLHEADKKDLREISRENKELAGHARANELKSHEIGGTTFTVSNLGMYDVESFSAIINPPEAASIAVGTIREMPVIIDGQVAVSKRMKATLSADHRVLDGAEAAKFLQEVKHRLESPIGLL